MKEDYSSSSDESEEFSYYEKKQPKKEKESVEKSSEKILKEYIYRYLKLKESSNDYSRHGLKSERESHKKQTDSIKDQIVELLEKDITIVQRIDYYNIFNLILILRSDLELLITITKMRDWSDFIDCPTTKLIIGEKDKSINCLMFAAIDNNQDYFKYLAEHYLSECTHGHILMYCVYTNYLEGLEYLIQLGYSLDTVIPRVENWNYKLKSNQEIKFKSIVPLLFDKFGSEMVFENLFMIFLGYNTEYMLAVISIYFTEYGYRDRMLDKLEENMKK